MTTVNKSDVSSISLRVLDKVFSIVGICGLLYFFWLLYGAADRKGYVPHWRDTPIYVGPTEWMLGELRDCRGLPDVAGRLIGLDCRTDIERAEQESRETTHVLRIKFWGRVERAEFSDDPLGLFQTMPSHNTTVTSDKPSSPDSTSEGKRELQFPDPGYAFFLPHSASNWRWSCKREESSIVCSALN